MPRDKAHRPEYSQNPDDTWNYKCTGCTDKKNNLRSKATGAIAFKAHIASIKHRTR